MWILGGHLLRRRHPHVTERLVYHVDALLGVSHSMYDQRLLQYLVYAHKGVQAGIGVLEDALGPSPEPLSPESER